MLVVVHTIVGWHWIGTGGNADPDSYDTSATGAGSGCRCNAGRPALQYDSPAGGAGLAIAEASLRYADVVGSAGQCQPD